MRRYYAKKELLGINFEGQINQNCSTIPAGAEVQFQGLTHSSGRIFAKVTYEGILYYVGPCDIERKEG